MRKYKRIGLRSIYLLMSLLIIFPSVLQASGNSSIYQSSQDDNRNASAKISKDLMKMYEDKSELTYLVKLKEQVNTSKVAEKASEQAKLENVSEAQLEIRQRSMVVSALRAKSIETQSDIIAFLESQEKEGTVKDYESFYIVNALAITSTKEVMEKVANFYEVEQVMPNRTRQLIDKMDADNNPKKLSKAEQTKASKKIGLKETETSASDSDNPDSMKSAEQSDTDNVAPNIEHIGAPLVWEEGIDGKGITIASIDTGVQWDHPALKTKYRGYNPNNPEKGNHEFNWFDAAGGQEVPFDDNGHGTHTVGTMVGSEADGSYQIGVAPGAQWIAVRAFTSVGGTDADILAAGEWVLAPKDANGNPHPEKAPDIVNNSWGGGPGMDEWYRPMVQNWRAAGIFPAFAAGNTTKDNPGGPGSVVDPGNYPESFTVGAVDEFEQLAAFSLLGPSPYDEIKPDVVAPGVHILSSIPGSGYSDGFSGTSMATPAVAGAVALLKQADASLSIDEMEQILIGTAIPLTDETYPETPNNGYGYGIINVYNAVSSLTNGLGKIEGRVASHDKDNEDPTYIHSAPKEAFTSIDIPLQITAKDNVGVEEVILEYRADASQPWQEVTAVQVDGTYKNGQYSASLPANAVFEPEVMYRWVILDYGQNEVISEVYHVQVKSAVSTGYIMDFESDPYGWTSNGNNDSWEWGEPDSGPHEANSGDKVFASNLTGEYKNNSNMTLMMPPIQMPEEGDVYLQFKQWYVFADESDAGQVLISTDQEDWELLSIVNGSQQSWKDMQVKLPDYTGQIVYIAFHLQSNNSVTADGWYIDDVGISHTPLDEEKESPQYDHESPLYAYNEMNLPLQVYVQDNGRISGVELHYLQGDTWKVAYTNLVKGAQNDGMYETYIPANAVAGDHVTYKWVISDYGGNETASETFELAIENGVTVGYQADFETEPGWLTLGKNNDWERGKPTSGPKNAISGENVYATNLSGPYAVNSNAAILMPPIDLPAGEAYLNLKSWYEFEYLYPFDNGQILISTDQERWYPLAHFSNIQTIWQYIELDLTEYANQRVYIAFNMLSDHMDSGSGWYIDDVTVSDTSIFDMQSTMTENLVAGMKAESDSAKANSLFKNQEWNKPKTVENVSASKTSRPADMMEMEADPSIPLDAKVTIQELNRYVKTDVRDGSYSIVVPTGSYTLLGEAYGYYPLEKTVEIIEGETAIADFYLETVPEGSITGVVTDQATGEPIAGATLLLKEDAAITPVMTDEQGKYSLTAYEGTYTLQVISPKYHHENISIEVIGEEEILQDVKLKPFISGSSDELVYDDGTEEGSRAFFDAGDGWAVRMSLAKGQKAALVTGGKFLFGQDFPVPGGTEFQLEIWDASGKDGAPGKKLLGPIDGTALRNGEWTTVDLRDYGIIVTDDFYMVNIQSKAHPYSTAISVDESSVSSQRGYGYVGGKWQQAPLSHGNYMIRALVDYEATAPVITAPSDESYVAEEAVSVKGTASPDTNVIIVNNGDEVAQTTALEDGSFAADIQLQEGKNKLAAYVKTDSGSTELSDEIEVIFDQNPPELTINKPIDGAETKDMAITIEGTVQDDYLQEVLVDGTAAEVSDDGKFTSRVLLSEGENKIKVIASDKAGNEQEQEVVVFAKFSGPEIMNLTPDTDIYLHTGESAKIEFNSEPGLKAIFIVHRSPMNLKDNGMKRFVEVPMMETTKGKYIGYWTVPSNWSASEAYIQVQVKDKFGNKTDKFAEGTIFVNPEMK